ncbi:MAG TPA: hypothetical protein VFS70_14455, partial [Actinomycetota bacterium]|nr:hypothetical protein [Actinomycetota bacterium]
SVRAVAYQLVVRGLIPSMAKTHTNTVSDDLVWARENEIIPWEWIVDETRREEALPVWADLEHFLRSVKVSYRRDLWADQAVHLEVWSEKGTVRAVLAPVLTQYRVPFRVLHGFNSATVVKDTADASLDLPTDKPFVALYIGDYDPSGWFMSEIDLPRRLVDYGGAIDLRRIALTWDDGPGRDPDPFTGQPLPGYDVLAPERLFPPQHQRAGQPKNNCTPRYVAEAGAGRTGYELDAMAPPTLRARVLGAIWGTDDAPGVIDRGVWAASLEEEEDDQARLDELIDAAG